jgi:hypothetical protein
VSDLSKSLVDAAAAADWQAHNAAVLKSVGRRGTLDEKRREISRARSCAVVVAVLETLATHTGPAPADGPVRVWFLNHEEFKRLAAEVREGTP